MAPLVEELKILNTILAKKHLNYKMFLIEKSLILSIPGPGGVKTASKPDNNEFVKKGVPQQYESFRLVPELSWVYKRSVVGGVTNNPLPLIYLT